MKAAAVAAPLLTALLLRFLAARVPETVETVYAHGAYPRVAAVLAGAGRLVPWSLAEVLCVFAALGVAGLVSNLALSRGRSLSKRLRLAAGWLVGGAGLLYLAFLLAWGLNYARPPLASLLGLDARPSGVAELVRLASELSSEADRLRAGLPEDGDGAMRLVDGRRGALSRVAAGFSALAPRDLFGGPESRLKMPLVSPILSRLGVAGIFSPYTGEPHVNATLPDFEIPFTASHELAHQRGFAREDEANYVAYAACRAHKDPDFRYSGTVQASFYALAALHSVSPPEAARLRERRSTAVRRDIEALEGWRRRYASRAAGVQRRVNDAYLRAQGQEEGVRSYGRMVDLLLAERRGGNDPP